MRATQWVSIQDKNVIVNGIFDNNQTGFKADFLKQFYYDITQKGWRIKVYVEKKYFSTTKLSLSDNYTLIYTFKDDKVVLNRATIYAAFPFGWTEMLETWMGQIWDIKRRVIMRKMDTTTPTKIPKSAVEVPTKKTVRKRLIEKSISLRHKTMLKISIFKNILRGANALLFFVADTEGGIFTYNIFSFSIQTLLFIQFCHYLCQLRYIHAGSFCTRPEKLVDLSLFLGHNFNKRFCINLHFFKRS